MCDVFCREVLQYTDAHPFVRRDCQISYRPVRTVTAAKGDLIATLDSQLLEQHM